MFHHFGWKLPIQGQIFRVFPQLLGNGWGLGGGVAMGTYWRPTVPNPMQAPKYDVQFLRSEALRSSNAAVVAAAVAVAGRGKLKNVK